MSPPDAETPRTEPESPRRRTGEHRARVGGRSERVVREVLSAAATELANVGYGALRVEDVAVRAGVNKTTVYRRWPTKSELVDAAIRSFAGPTAEVPDTGSLRGDLLALLDHAMRRNNTCEGRGFMRMIAMEIDDPEVAGLVRSVRKEFRAPWLSVLGRAVERGELPPEADALLMTEIIMSTTMSRLAKRMDPVDAAFCGAVVDVVIRGAGGREAPNAE